jgi:hypothetical protein
MNMQIAGVLLVSWMMTGCATEKQAEAKPVRPVRVVEAKANANAENPRVRYSANIIPREQVGVAFKTAGYIREVLQVPEADGRLRTVQEGDRVRQGTVLARVDVTDYAEKQNQARASLREAEAGLQKARTDFERAARLLATQSIIKPEYVWMIVNCKNGVRSYEMSSALGITQKSAWHMMHRIRRAMQDGSFRKFAGEVEADETFIRGLARNMHASKRNKRFRDGTLDTKTIVMGLLERHGPERAHSTVRTKMLPTVSKMTLSTAVMDSVTRVNHQLTFRSPRNFTFLSSPIIFIQPKDCSTRLRFCWLIA